MDKDDEFMKALNPYLDGHPVFTLNHRAHEIIMDALESDFAKDHEKFIEWWFFDKADHWVEWKNKRWPTETPEQLYDFLEELYARD